MRPERSPRFVILLPLLVAGTAGTVIAQVDTGSIGGTVVDARTSTPLSGVLVERQGTDVFVVTAADGSFELDAVPVGEQTLYVSVVGYALARPVVVVAPAERTVVTIPLAEGTGAYTERITVTAADTPGARTPAPAMQTLTSAGLQELRGVLADDPFRAVHAVPGVAAGDDFRSEFSIRGGDFRHIGLSIDGVASRWLVHTVRGVEDTGSISLLNGDVLERITIASGTYPQKFGDRTGGWVDSEIREGSRDARAIRVSLSGTGASGVLEGPLAGRRGSWIVSVRQSYLDWLLRHITDENGIVFGFTDTQAKVAYDLSSTHRLDASFVGGRSKLTEADSSPGSNALRLGTSRTALLTARITSTLRNAWVVEQRLAVLGGDFRNSGFFQQALSEGNLSELSYSVGTSWAPNDTVLVEVGGRSVRESVRLVQRQYGLATTGGVLERRSDQLSAATWRTSALVGARWALGKRVGLHPGVLVMHHDLTGETNGAPWLTASWAVTSWSDVRAGVGLVQQAPEIEQVLGPDGSPELRGETARTMDAALDLRFGADMVVTLGAYERGERDFIRMEGAEIRLVNGQIVQPQGDQRYENALRGTARGVELLVRRNSTRGISGWASYSFGCLRYRDTLTHEHFWGDFDQRHAVNVHGLYQLSPRTSLSAKLRFGSNFPLPGYFASRAGTLFVGPLRNTERLPAYGRLDVRANRTFNYAKRRLTLFVEVLNVLNRTNLGPADGTIRVRTGEALGFVETLLPLLPSAGLSIEF